MTTVTKKSLKVGKYVDTAHVDQVVRNYKKERWLQNSLRIGKEDSLSAWYSVEELEEFIQKIKQYDADGIKLYFGAYPEDYTERPEYASRQTVVLVATKSKETEEGLKHKDVYITDKNGASTIMGYNMGSICPPFCGGFMSKSKSKHADVGLTIVDKGEEGLAII
jgi:hypothetical protein